MTRVPNQMLPAHSGEALGAVLLSSVCAMALACGFEGPTRSSDPGDSPELDCPSFTAASAGLPVKGEWRSHPSVGDVNGDGLADIAAIARKGDGPKVFLGDGLGGWADASDGLDFGRGFSCGIGTRLVDVDGDDRVDLVVADHCKGVLVYSGDGGSTWADGSQGIPRNVQGFNDADVGDITGDGRLDIVAVSAFSRGFLVLEGVADGTWRILSDTGLPSTGMGFELQLADVTRDGLLDIVTTFNPASAQRRETIPPPAKVWIQGPIGKFRPASGFPELGRFFGLATLPRSATAADDLLFALIGARAGLYRFESSGTDTWEETQRIDENWFEGDPQGFIGVDVADFDLDGCMDIVATGGSERRVSLAMGDCEGQWTLCPAGTLPVDETPSSGWGVVARDLNADGRPDIVAAFGLAGKGSIRAWMQD